MPRTSRMIIADEKAIYHVMSRTALDGFPLKDVEKDFMVDLIKYTSSLFFTEILGCCLMGNHFHLIVKMIPENRFTDEEIQKRFETYYVDSRDFIEGRFHIYVKSCPVFQNLYARSKLALHGFTTVATTGAGISGATGSRVSLLKREKPWSIAWPILT